MQPHNSKSSRENATPSRGTYPLAYYYEVPNPLHPPPLLTHRGEGGGGVGIKIQTSIKLEKNTQSNIPTSNYPLLIIYYLRECLLIEQCVIF